MYTLAHELELGRRSQQGDIEARNLLITANIEVVNSLWRLYAGRGRDEDDIRQDGYMGLLRASETYDPALGLRFSTWATYQVKDCMKDGVSRHGRPVRLPYGVSKAYTKMRKFKQGFFDEHGVEPSYEQVEEAIGFDEKKQKAIMHHCKPVIGSGSLEGELELLDDLGDETDVDLGYIIKVKSAVGRLPYSQHQVVERYFGLHQGQPETIEDISLRMRCTKEVVSRLKSAALDHVKTILQNVVV